MDRLDAVGDEDDVLFKTAGGTMQTHHIEALSSFNNPSHIGANQRFGKVGASTGSFDHSLDVGSTSTYNTDDYTRSDLSSVFVNSWGSNMNRPHGFYMNHGVWRPYKTCLLYTSPSPRDRQKSRMPSSA